MTDHLCQQIVDALTAAAHDCDGQCGLDEQACYDAHPLTVSARIGGTTHVDGPVTAIADIAMNVRDRRMEQLAAGRETWKSKGEEIERDLDRLASLLGEVIDAFEGYWVRASYDGPEASYVPHEQFAAWRRAINPVTDAEADAELDKRLNALKEKP